MRNEGGRVRGRGKRVRNEGGGKREGEEGGKVWG